LREHWVLVTAAVCLLLIALIGGTAYWLDVKDYESTDDALIARRSFFLRDTCQSALPSLHEGS
jgi:membrane fusion protein (multidrug efflux system)